MSTVTSQAELVNTVLLFINKTVMLSGHFKQKRTYVEEILCVDKQSMLGINPLMMATYSE